ncbi:hypothetical protein Glove_91g30 [Diversispora epigaea]|uniref:Uncharacterized protein n=1 Tax=Diversispora epigaea TaxID=1348612 RepID=A0A397J9P4_9GLOM|nr:hypothetical protein Glove_91g30 [Diversispora epigaea]
MSTRRKLCASKNPPRPPNSYLLMKNCYMLELRAIGLRLTMPELCIQSKHLCKEAPKEVKDRYEEIQLKPQTSTMNCTQVINSDQEQDKLLNARFSHERAANITTFSSTNYLKRPAFKFDNYLSMESEAKSPALSSSSDSSKTNYSPKISTPTFSDSLEYSPPLSNQFDQIYIENDLLTFSFSNVEEFNESLESFDPSLDFAKNFQSLQYSYAYNPNEILNVPTPIGTGNIFFDLEQCTNLIENNENNGYEFVPFY